ncbi:MAG: translocation/assembly module TamB domain-containing protein [Proteobacteria bacterium]|nr:translocation/assembly module TamB domain-containing protein [Pseudomonadota bacterium]MBU1057130.1 translocation/assembly module TamB domain-containing protein [Pseudomonadota bacterium]
MKKILRLLTWVFLPPLLLAIAFCLFLATESGFRLLVGLGDSLSGPLFSVGQVRGHLLSSWQLEKVQLNVNGVAHVELEELAFSWLPGALFDKELRVQGIKARGLVVRLDKSDPATEDENKPERIAITLPDIRLPLALELADVQFHDAELFFPGSVDSFPVHELLLQVSARDDQVHISRLKLESPVYGGELQAEVRLSGSWPLELSGEWRVTDPALTALHGALAANGDMEALAVSVELKAPAVATVQGQLTKLLGDLHWQVSAKTEYLALQDFKVDLPIDGALSAAEVSGGLETYGGTLAADVHYEGYPQVQVRTEVEGDFSALTIHSLQILLDQARLTSSGQIGWGDGFSWQAELEGEQLDPSQFASQWPGKIDTLLHSQGEWKAGKLVADLKIDHLQGELRDFPLTGSGQAGIDGETLVVDALHLQSGSTRLQVNGRANGELDFAFQAGSADLASLIPESSGVFQLQGTVGGRREEPRLAMTVDASALKVKDIVLKSLKAVVNADLAGQGQIEADLKAAGLELPGQSIDKVQLQVQGSLAEHRLDLSLATTLGALQLALTGGLEDQEWQGKLAELMLQSNQYGEWQTEQAVPLHLTKTNMEVGEFSLLQDQVRISLGGKWQEEEGWQLQGGVKDFSLKLLEEWELVSQQLDGTLSATVKAMGKGAVLDHAGIVAALPDLSLTALDEEGQSRTWHWTDNELQVRLEDNDAQVRAKTLFQDGSVAELEAVVGNYADFSKPEEMTLAGTLALNVKDLSPLAPLSDYRVNATGQFVGSGNLQGTVARPVIEGKMALQNGLIQLADAGIEVQELELSVSGDGTTNKVALALASGEGRLKVEGFVKQDLEKQWQADFTVKGKDFPAVDLSEYTAVISPDLHFVYGEKGIVLNGSVTVPKARIAPAGFQGAVSSSQDVVLVDTNGEHANGTLPMSLDLSVILGEEVKVDAFGLRGSLDGQLKINQDPGQIITGQGSLNLHNGTFAFRGTSLEIKRGLVFYQGGSIEDPGLDVRASKNVHDKIVGIQVTGSVSRMEMNLFSDPAMEESDILAYILVGHDMSTSNEKEGSMLGAVAATLGGGTGTGLLDGFKESTGLDVSLEGGESISEFSLVVGKEIYEDLYISYGKGLKDPAGTFQARYELKYGFSVKTEATSEATGADLLWSLER